MIYTRRIIRGGKVPRLLLFVRQKTQPLCYMKDESLEFRKDLLEQDWK